MEDALPTIQIYYPDASGRAELTLTLGETFEARARMTHQGLVLLHGEHRIPARADVALSDGDRLLLQVVDFRPHLTLRVVGHFGRRPALEGAVREGLPRQISAADFVTRLQAVRAATPPLPAELDSATEDFLRSLSSPQQLRSGSGVAAAITRSGLFFEHRLAGLRSGAPEGDLKGGLARWMEALERHNRSTPPCPANSTLQYSTPRERHLEAHSSPRASANELLQIADGLLHRIRALQAHLALSPTPDDWTVDLPIRDGEHLDAVRLRVRRTPSSDALPRWHADIHLRLTGIGEVSIGLYLHAERLDLAWWAEERATAEAFAAAIDEMGQRIVDAGLTPGALTCYHGRPAQDRTAPTSIVTPGIINEQI